MKRKSQNWVEVSSVPSKYLFLAIAVKIYAKADIKVFWSYPIWDHSFNTYGKFSEKQTFLTS